MTALTPWLARVCASKKATPSSRFESPTMMPSTVLGRRPVMPASEPAMLLLISSIAIMAACTRWMPPPSRAYPLLAVLKKGNSRPMSTYAVSGTTSEGCVVPPVDQMMSADTAMPDSAFQEPTTTKLSVMSVVPSATW